MLAVTASDLTYAYRDRVALDRVSFEVEEHEIFAFLGPNGSGKSTLFRLLATLEPVPHGDVSILGFDLHGPLAEARRALGVVFQSPALDPVLTVEENLGLQARLFGVGRAEATSRIDLLLERFDLADRRRDSVGRLSGGLRRRVELARALVHRPRLLLLDEPSTGLDPAARRRFWDLLERVRREEGVTVLLTTHFMEEADRCDRLVVLHRGRIVTEGSPADLKRQLAGDVVVLGSADPERLRRSIEEQFPGRVQEPTVFGPTVRFVSGEASRLAPELLEAFPALVDAVTVAHPTLEDVFLDRTGEALR